MRNLESEFQRQILEEWMLKIDMRKELNIDTFNSPYLQDVQTNVHDLQCYLNVEFKFEINRDIKLENKYIDCLKDEYSVVAKWWSEKHKSMVQIHDGSWVLIDHEKDEEDEDDDDDGRARASLVFEQATIWTQSLSNDPARRNN